MSQRPQRAVIYLRISLALDGDDAGVRRQEDACRRYCEDRGWEIVGVEEDNSVSAYSGKDRPGWGEVLRLARSGEVDQIVAWKADRISRSTRTTADLADLARETGVGIATVDGSLDLSSASGKLVADILAASAEAESRLKGERQRAAHTQRRRQGRPWWTRRPFGYRMDGALHEVEAPMVQDAYRDVLAGASLSSVARQWRDAGMTTTGGGPIRPSFVRQLLMNPRNIARVTGHEEMRQGGKVVKVPVEVGDGDWTPLIDEPTFRAVVAHLNSPSRRTAATRRTGLLTGVLICGICGGRMGSASQTQEGRTYRYVACRQSHNAWPRDWTEQHLQRLALFALTADHLPEVGGAGGGDLVSLTREVQRLEELEASLLEDRKDGLLRDDQWREAQRDVLQRRSATQDALTALGQGDPLREVRHLSSVERREHWEGLDTDGRRDLILTLFGHVTAQPRGRGQRTEPDPHLLTPERGSFSGLLRAGVTEGASVDSDMLGAALSATRWRLRP